MPAIQFDVISVASTENNGDPDESTKTIDIVNTHKNQDWENTGVVANALIEMVQGTRITRRLTDAKGRFSFDALVPGKYILKIKGARIPDHHRLENETLAIELSRGEHQEMEFKVIPVKRAMKMLPSEPLIIEESE